MRAAIAVRDARAADVERLAELAGQLGYPSTTAEVAERLPGVVASPEAALLVATDGPVEGRVVGWIHLELKHSLLAPLAAQVMGLVVDEGRRGDGIGADLLSAGERWARHRGCRTLLVGTRVTREDAHRFYRRSGFTLLKTSHFFEKLLA